MAVTFDPTETARLIAETREDDARMTRSTWMQGELEETVHLLTGGDEVLERDVAAVARLRNNAKPLADQLEAAAKEVERLTRVGDNLEQSTGQLIDQRDKREAQIDAIADALGDEGEWSNLHDRGKAALELADGIVAEVARLSALEFRLIALFETADPEVISQTMDMVIRDRDAAATRANEAIEALGRMAPVVEAAERWYDSGGHPDDGERATSNLANAIADLRARKP